MVESNGRATEAVLVVTPSIVVVRELSSTIGVGSCEAVLLVELLELFVPNLNVSIGISEPVKMRPSRGNSSISIEVVMVVVEEEDGCSEEGGG